MNEPSSIDSAAAAVPGPLVRALSWFGIGRAGEPGAVLAFGLGHIIGVMTVGALGILRVGFTWWLPVQAMVSGIGLGLAAAWLRGRR